MAYVPLAARMRPKSLNNYIGQKHIIEKTKPLGMALAQKKIHSMIFWGPPGVGKTTLAKLISKHCNLAFESVSAVLIGVKEIRDIVARAKQSGQPLVLFVDEVHRFNKSQQDAFLPHVEEGTIVLIGATTENPSFELNNALLSRTRVYVLKPFTDSELLLILNQAMDNKINGYGEFNIDFDNKLKNLLISYCDGDARRCLNLLELLIEPNIQNNKLIITQELIEKLLENSPKRFDKHGDIFYDQISALHKSVRGSNPDAALYWLNRMLDAGCDRHYVARRLIRMASEDIGNADPRALQITLNAWEAFDKLGIPEGDLALSQAVIYLASCAKSNAVYTAHKKSLDFIAKTGSLPVPNHLCNAPTKLLKEIGHGENYQYAHDYDGAYVPNENYFPENIKKPKFYEPVERGLEIKIKEKLNYLKKMDKTNG